MAQSQVLGQGQILQLKVSDPAPHVLVSQYND